MADLLSIGSSALLAYRKALDTAGHNIANVNTSGYSRQRVELSSRLGAPSGDGYVGAGVMSDTVRRLADQLLVARGQADASGLGRADIFATLAGRVDQLLSSGDAGLARPLQAFFDSVSALSVNPASTPARQSVLASAQTLVARLGSIQGQLDGMEQETDLRVQQNVDEINGYAGSIASLNQRIVLARAQAGGQPPNDLIDQRDQLVNEISSRIGVNTVQLADGTLNVFVAGGQALVLGQAVNALGTRADAFNSGRLEVTFGTGATAPVISSQLGGGSLGGLFDVRREVLDPARNELGRIAATLAQSFNDQNSRGVDQAGALGGDFFAPPAGTALAATANSGSAAIAVGFADVSQLSGHDYEMRFDGGNWHLFDTSAGSELAMAGAGTAASPFTAAGLSLTVSGSAAAGDRFAIEPTRNVAGDLRLALTDPAQIAAASPIRSSAGVGNTGAATISAGQVLDAADPALRTAVTIQFTSATTYTVNGSGSFTYTSGNSIDINGWRVQIAGSVATGDSFQVQATPAGSSDNTNARALAGLATRGLLDSGRTSLGDAHAALVGRTGNTAQQASLQRDAQSALKAQTDAQRESVSGVNLDEEAADMLRFQQAYQAAAKIIEVANSLFQSLLDAARR